MIYIKRGVNPKNLTIMAAVANVAQLDELSLTVTSGTDGKHMKGSKHYVGDALDIRTRGLDQAQVMLVATHISERLGNGYDVVVEKDHIHVEYDPK